MMRKGRTISTYTDDENLDILHQDIARAFLNYQYRQGQRALETTVDPDFLNALTTEDEIIHAAIALTQNVHKCLTRDKKNNLITSPPTPNPKNYGRSPTD
ncbi:hypothetical protein [Spirulina sp. 06S082]|uniref:hypothetical protein n=1 Tax=Spirulina sp. 06S082 TaxID=3110248 RepID=UPI002B1F09F4|nr:hypothetical protein [Spirulina sp. 06S082]MEA5467455.1 hypothetical protein [Spirulina sp. 06S082]